MRILVSAYACEPGKGSEPAVGWGTALAAARCGECWVVTRSNNRESIEAALADIAEDIHWVYVDLPAWLRRLKRGDIGTRLYYRLWQWAAAPVVRRLCAEHDIDVVHHATFASYWASARAAAMAGRRFVWGPVGGGEDTPDALRSIGSVRSRVFELLRSASRRLAEAGRDTRSAATAASTVFCSTPETAARVAVLGAERCVVRTQIVFTERELEQFSFAARRASASFLYVGRLVGWRGVELAVRALALVPEASLTLVGDGAERRGLQRLADALGVADRVRFLGEVGREDVAGLMAQSAALLYPSLHDSAGYAVAEAMLGGLPVVCLATGGPSALVDESRGFPVEPGSIEETVHGLARRMREVLAEPAAAEERARAASAWARENLSVGALAAALGEAYGDIEEASRCAS